MRRWVVANEYGVSADSDTVVRRTGFLILANWTGMCLYTRLHNIPFIHTWMLRISGLESRIVLPRISFRLVSKRRYRPGVCGYAGSNQHQRPIFNSRADEAAIVVCIPLGRMFVEMSLNTLLAPWVMSFVETISNNVIVCNHRSMGLLRRRRPRADRHQSRP